MQTCSCFRKNKGFNGNKICLFIEYVPYCVLFVSYSLFFLLIICCFIIFTSQKESLSSPFMHPSHFFFFLTITYLASSATLCPLFGLACVFSCSALTAVFTFSPLAKLNRAFSFEISFSSKLVLS